MAPTTRKSYDAEFKLNVVAFAKENGNRAAERKFNVSEKIVRDWRKKEDELRSTKKTKKANRSGKASWPVLEENLRKWTTVKSKKTATKMMTPAMKFLNTFIRYSTVIRKTKILTVFLTQINDNVKK